MTSRKGLLVALLLATVCLVTGYPPADLNLHTESTTVGIGPQPPASETTTASSISTTSTVAPNSTTTPVPITTKPTTKPTTTSTTTTTTTSTTTTTTTSSTTTENPSTTSVKPNNSTTTVSPKPTTINPEPSPTPKPTVAPGSTTTSLPTTPATPSKGRHFDGLSFMGGIILTTCLVGLSIGSYKFYKIRTERSYRTL